MGISDVVNVGNTDVKSTQYERQKQYRNAKKKEAVKGQEEALKEGQLEENVVEERIKEREKERKSEEPLGFFIRKAESSKKEVKTSGIYKAAPELAALAAARTIPQARAVMMRARNKIESIKRSNMDEASLKTSIRRIKKVISKCGIKIRRLRQEVQIEKEKKIAKARERERYYKELEQKLKNRRRVRKQEEYMDIVYAAEDEKNDKDGTSFSGDFSTGEISEIPVTTVSIAAGEVIDISVGTSAEIASLEAGIEMGTSIDIGI